MNEDGSAISSELVNAGGSSPVETELRLPLDQIDDTEDSYESTMSRINDWREMTSSDIEVYLEIEEDSISEVIEEQREESSAEIELREKLKLLQSLLNEQENELNQSSDESDEDQIEKSSKEEFRFLMSEMNLKDLFFLQILHQCSPFSSIGGVSKAFGKCAHLLRTGEVTKEYFNNLGINSGKRLLKERYLLLKSWINTQGFSNFINSSSQTHQEEIRELMRELIEEEIKYTTHKQSRDIHDQTSVLSGSSYGSVSSCESSFESESGV
ncbi:hypothetical protein DFH28DRAFT_1133085 [Melampsora americana]|nr:hypothetical protein DFH28DRAFT_1133085 [Melampsora americana]